MVTAIANHVDTLSLNRIIHMLVCHWEGLQHKQKVSAHSPSRVDIIIITMVIKWASWVEVGSAPWNNSLHNDPQLVRMPDGFC